MVMQTILWHARATFLTWRSRTATDCALGQLIARIFLITEWALSRVHAAEESPADRRGQVLNVLTTELFSTECRAEALACTNNLLGRMAFVIASALVVRWPIRSAGAIPVQLPRRSLSSRWPCSFASCPRRRVPSSKRQRGCRHESVDARPAGVVGFDSPIVCPGAIAWDDTHRKALRQPKQTQLQSSRGRGSAPAPRPVQPSWSYLDVGCGNGAAARLVADTFGMHVVGVDVDPQQIALARNASGDRTDVLFMTADAACLPFEGGRFDIVATNKTTHHVPEWSSALAEMGRVLKPQRYLVYADLKTPSWLAWLLKPLAGHAGVFTGAELDRCFASLQRIHRQTGWLHYEVLPEGVNRSGDTARDARLGRSSLSDSQRWPCYSPVRWWWAVS